METNIQTPGSYVDFGNKAGGWVGRKQKIIFTIKAKIASMS